ncbi:MAG: cobyric acid synthase [Leptotrichia sp.]|nr:cobyric acid synthase [Leptotrichia sp.]
MGRNHKNIMLLGTGSNVGKSIIAAGLCRVFYQDGYSVAPFKSQNMALNSYITKDGKEMGRAQVVQAEAANIEPEAFMNPILLKPTTDRKSQVIVNGKVYKNMDAREYFAYKHNLKKDIMEAYNHIRENFDICVLEGAGSPAEINLKEDDIVNTGMAEMADSPVLLVADIDRGGVFAAIYGTVMLLEENERKRIKGVIINKFRGDKSLLTSGIEMIEKLTDIPVLGVVPFVPLGIEEEDSLGIDKYNEKKEGKIRISVIKLKHISNFTDIDALSHYNDVSLKYVTKSSELGNEDIIIIPGSKNTVEDMKDLIEKNIGREIVRIAKKGTPVFGICGGFQMMGQKIMDPEKIESDLKEISGLGLLDIETVMKSDKTTTQYKNIVKNVSGILSGTEGMEIKGYEIHQGYSYPVNEKNEENNNSENILKNDTACLFGDENLKGTVKDNVAGTYIHGIFDNSEFTSHFLNEVRKLKGLDRIDENFSYSDYKNREYDKLAEVLRENIDIKKIYEIMGCE